MGQPFLATKRMMFQYVVSGLTHTAHLYVKNTSPSGGSFTIGVRPSGVSTLNFHDAADALHESWSTILPSGSTFGQTHLQQLVGQQWQDMEVYTPVSTNHAAGTLLPAGEVTLVLRDTSYFPVKVVALDPNTTAPLKFNDVPSIPSGSLGTFAEQFSSFFNVANAPWNWQVSRANNFMASSGGFVSAVTTLNRKTRRRRSLA